MDKQVRQSEAGYTLITVVGIFAVLTILGFSIILLSSASVKTSTKEKNDQTAFYIAESGITIRVPDLHDKLVEVYDKLIDELAVLPNEIAPSLEEREQKYYDRLKDEIDGQTFETEPEDFEEIQGNIPHAKIKVEYVEDNKYRIISTGHVNGEDRVVENEFTIKWNEDLAVPEIPPFALLAREQLIVDNTNLLEGDIGSYGIDLNGDQMAYPYISFNQGKVEFNDQIYLPFNPDGTFDEEAIVTTTIEGDFTREDDIVELPVKPFPFLPTKVEVLSELDEKLLHSPLNPISNLEHNGVKVIENNELEIKSYNQSDFVLKMTENLSFKYIGVKAGYELNIDLQGEDRIIVVDQFNIENGFVNLLPGKGRLTIYVNDIFKIASSSVINPYEGFVNETLEDFHPPMDLLNQAVDRLNIYYLSDLAPSFGVGNEKTFGSFFIVSDQADFNLSASSSIYGNILSNGKNVTIQGGTGSTNQLILAPNAKINLKAGGNIAGSVIGNSIHLEGGTKIKHVAPEEIEISGSLSYDGIIEYNETNHKTLMEEPPDMNLTPIKEKRN